MVFVVISGHNAYHRFTVQLDITENAVVTKQGMINDLS